VIEYIEVTLDDIALANELAHEVLGRSLDELPPQTRRVLKVIEMMVEEQCRERSIGRVDARFTRRELRGRSGMSDTAVRIHLERLIAMEYVRCVAGRNGQRFEYELLFDGDLKRAAPQMIGLIDVHALGRVHTSTIATSQGQVPDLAGGLQAARTPVAPALQGAVLAENCKDDSDLPDRSGVGSEKAPLGRQPLEHRSVDGRRVSAGSAPSALSSSLAASSASGR
jgi:hypothetical protein